MRRKRFLAMAVALGFIGVVITDTAKAIEVVDLDFFSRNDITGIYEPRAVECSITDEASQGPVTGSDNLEKILRFLTGKGMTLAGAAGIAGNMQQESGLSPSIIQGGNTAPKNYKPVNSVGFGLVQWTFGGTVSGRQGGLYMLSQSKKMDITDINLQLEYTWKELSGPYKKSTLDKIISIGDPVQAAIIAHDNYEISADSDEAVKRVRGGNAKRFFTQFKGKIDDGTAVSTSSAESGSEDSGCGTTTGGLGISDGFVFPLKTTQTIIRKGDPVSGATWCIQATKNCHHTANAADISAPEGTEIVAARSGTVVGANPINGNCASSSIGCNLTFLGDDGVLYYYAHMKQRDASIKRGSEIKAGQVVALVGTKAMAIGTHPHLHINALPGSKYKTQPGCLKGNCPGAEDYIDVQPALVKAFNKLPK